jgi:aminopeptidase N
LSARLLVGIALLLVPVAGAAQQSAMAMPGPGVSLELARHRAATLSDITYDLHFDLPGDTAAPITGRATIGVRRSGDDPLVLDFADPARIRSLKVGGDAVRWERAATHVIIPATALPAGRAEITVAFLAGDAPLNRRGEFLYSLFVPDRAHEAFPGFDQPDLKARYRLRLSVPADWRAVANGEVVEREETAEGRVVYTFAETAPLPTYLFAFAAGRFEVEEADRGGRRLRLIHRETDPEKIARSRDAIFDLHADALSWLEDYTGIPYPFGKFDIVAIPSFQYGGMEHPGAILYRASSLFLDESATQNQELGRASLIAHETAHMWFGDLVTMRWFDDVWMKEVFANFMAAKIVNPSFPDVDHELRFLLAHYPAAYSVDRTPGANPIRQPLDNLADAGTLYGAIIYQKAPIVMRQLERLTGEEAMRTALRRYLDAHRFGNAGWPALVAELDRVTELDVPAWSRVWIEEPGRPHVGIDWSVRTGGGRIQLRPSDPAEKGRVWPQRTRVARLSSVAGAGPAADTAVLLGRPLVLAPAEAADVTLAGSPEQMPAGGGDGLVLPNVDGLGYGLFLLDPVSQARLLESLPRLDTSLARAAAWLDLHELMLEGRVAPAALMELGMRTVRVEDDELVAQAVLGDLRRIFWRFLEPAAREALAPSIEALLEGRTAAVQGVSAKAAHFNAWRDVATTGPAVDRMRAVWEGEEVPGLPLSERDRTRLALELAVRDIEGAKAVLDAQEARIENPDRRARFAFIRRAASPDPEVRRRWFESLARRENRAREEWVVTGLSLLHHPLRAETSLRYVRPGLDLLREVKETGDIFFPTRWLAAILGGHASPEAAAIVRRFIDEHPDYPSRLMGKLLQQADPLFRAVSIH